MYNRSSEYARLEKLFNMEELMIPAEDNLVLEDDERRQLEVQSQTASQSSWLSWRNLIPVIKFDINDVSKHKQSSSVPRLVGSHLITKILCNRRI